jgi:hypothetical protein
MTKEEVVDETEKFESTSSDLPVVQSEDQEAKIKEESANSDELGTDDKEKEQVKADAGDDATAEHDKEKKPNRVQERINKVIKERETEKREKEALQRKLADLEKPGKQESKEEPGKTQDKEPVEGDYEDYDKYLDALDEFESAQEEKPKEKEEEKQEEDKPAKLSDSQKTALAVIREAVGAAEEIPQDFDEVALNPDVPITGEMLEALAECDNPAKIMYHLGKNPELATEISGGTPAQQMRSIARLDLPGAVKPEKPVKLTNASDPITPVNGSDVQEKKLEEMSFSEHEEYMNKKEQKRNRW